MKKVEQVNVVVADSNDDVGYMAEESFVTQVKAQTKVINDSMTLESIKQLVDMYAEQQYKAEILATIACESGRNKDGTFNPLLQSNFVDSAGAREKSYGIAQINIPAHPEITIEEAQDPIFSVKFMAAEFKKGNKWKWTCWRSLFAK